VQGARRQELLPGVAVTAANVSVVDGATGRVHVGGVTTQRSEIQNSFGYEMLTETSLWEARHRMVRLAMQVPPPHPPPSRSHRSQERHSFSSTWVLQSTIAVLRLGNIGGSQLEPPPSHTHTHKVRALVSSQRASPKYG
jgi:hypothetical protein